MIGEAATIPFPIGENLFSNIQRFASGYSRGTFIVHHYLPRGVRSRPTPLVWEVFSESAGLIHGDIAGSGSSFSFFLEKAAYPLCGLRDGYCQL
jgi:hypothetical protein